MEPAARPRIMDADAWDERYRGTDLLWGVEPNRFLREEVETLSPGRALDLACGEGRNAVWLATRGWDVTGVDFSTVALEKAAELAGRHDVDCAWERADLEDWATDEAFDLVVVCYVQVPDPPRSAILAVAAGAVAAGGTLVVIGHDETNPTEGIGGPQDPSVLYGPDDLRRDVAGSAVTLEIERAERVLRPVPTDRGTVDAVDCLLRAHRP